MAAQLDCLKQRWRKLTVSGPPFLEQDHVCRVQVASGVQKFQPAAQSVFQTDLSVPSSLPQPIQNAEINADTGLHSSGQPSKAVVYRIHSGTCHHLLWGSKIHAGVQNLTLFSHACPEIFSPSVLSLNFVSVCMYVCDVHVCMCMCTSVYLCVSVGVPYHSMHMEVRGQL